MKINFSDNYLFSFEAAIPLLKRNDSFWRRVHVRAVNSERVLFDFEDDISGGLRRFCYRQPHTFLRDYGAHMSDEQLLHFGDQANG